MASNLNEQTLLPFCMWFNSNLQWLFLALSNTIYSDCDLLPLLTWSWASIISWQKNLVIIVIIPVCIRFPTPCGHEQPSLWKLLLAVDQADSNLEPVTVDRQALDNDRNEQARQAWLISQAEEGRKRWTVVVERVDGINNGMNQIFVAITNIQRKRIWMLSVAAFSWDMRA